MISTTINSRFQLLVLICQTVGVTNINSIPNVAVWHGTLGSVLIFFLVYFFLGIPLLYMELIIGQFTSRDCVSVWKIRKFLSYTGYVLILWQIVILIYNHVFVSFTVHYFLISFENPIPYYECGPWSTRDCNILAFNYTVNQDCVRQRLVPKYCDDLYTTFPELQYWRNYILRDNDHYKLYIAWRVCLASGLVCIFLYVSCFKRRNSMVWIVRYLPAYPILGFLPVMLGSMLQKGVVAKFEEAIDLDFKDFNQSFRISNAIQHVVYCLGIGTGITFNFASNATFRSNCFSNSVISVVISAVFSILVIFTIALMTCPYAYHYGVSPGAVIKSQMSLIFEKVPRLLSQYDHNFFWLILVYSCYSVVGLCTNMLLFYNFLETVPMRFQKISYYPGLTCLVATVLIFLITIPLLSNLGIIFALAFRHYITLVSTFVAMIECIVFVISYGIHKFSEDVHFMLGIQPSFYMKTAWVLASVLLGYAFFFEIIYMFKKYNNSSVNMEDKIGLYIVSTLCAIIVVLFAVKILVALCRGKLLKVFQLEQGWGPKSDLLQRSRAMFSAQAMTEEYMYRQYHLQAGITARQRNSNKRINNEFEDQRFSI